MKEITCCKLGKENIHFKTAKEADADEDGFFLYLKSQYPDGYYEPILFCPFCGQCVPHERMRCNTDPKRREVEVGIHFDFSKMTETQQQLIWSATTALKSAGIGFDTGCGGGFDWEWDWSLSGPVKVLFREFVQNNPKNRYYWEKKKREEGNVSDPVDNVNRFKKMKKLAEDVLEEDEETN